MCVPVPMAVPDYLHVTIPEFINHFLNIVLGLVLPGTFTRAQERQREREKEREKREKEIEIEGQRQRHGDRDRGRERGAWLDELYG